MSGVPILKFLFRSESPVLSEAIKLNHEIGPTIFHDEKILVNFIKEIPASLVIVSLANKNDLKQLVVFFKLAKKIAKDSYFKVLVINSSSEDHLRSAAEHLDISELVNDKIQAKVLEFKINYLIRSISARIKNNLDVSNSSTALTLENSTLERKRKFESVPHWSTPLDCEDDIWLMRDTDDCKKVLTRWLIKIMGPSPFVGQWAESGHEKIWKFYFRFKDNAFISKKGSWYFSGEQKPEFDWDENSWLFKGEDFELFYKLGKVFHSRIRLKNKVLIISKNSTYAKAKVQNIIESFDKELVQKRPSPSNVETTATQKYQEDSSYLKGKATTDILKEGPLTGKGKTSALNSELLTLNLKPGENQISSGENLETEANLKSLKFWKGLNEMKEESPGMLHSPTSGSLIDGGLLDFEAGKSFAKIDFNSDLSNVAIFDEFENIYTGTDSKKKLSIQEIEANKKNVLPFNEAQLLSKDSNTEIGEATESAKVTSIIYQDSLKRNCQLDDYFDETILLSTKESGILASKSVTLNLNFFYMKKDTTIKIEGLVVSVEKNEEGLNFITIEISNNNRDIFSSFMKLYQNRQKNIDLFIKAAKGL